MQRARCPIFARSKPRRHVSINLKSLEGWGRGHAFWTSHISECSLSCNKLNEGGTGCFFPIPPSNDVTWVWTPLLSGVAAELELGSGYAGYRFRFIEVFGVR